MKLGVNLINFGPSANPSNLAGWVAHTESAGFHSLLTSDHLVTTPEVHERYPAPFYEPLTTLGWLAGRTERITIGATVMVLPYRHPVETARAFANLDQLSGGRVILGAGIGWARSEFDALNIEPARRGAMTDEYLDVIRRYWTSDRLSYDGQFVQLDDIHTAPRPHRRPHPPIWIGGSSPAALRRVVRFGDAWHPINLRSAWLADKGLPRLNAAAEAEGKPRPALCPRIRFRITESREPDDSRYMGYGTLDQIRSDLSELEALGAEHVLLDTYCDDIERSRDVESAWAMLATVADKAFDLAAETVR